MRTGPQVWPGPVRLDGRPVEPVEAFDLLADMMLNVVTASLGDPKQRQVLMERWAVFVEDVEEEAGVVGRSTGERGLPN